MNNESVSGTASQEQPADAFGEFGFSERDFEDTTASLQRHRSKNSLPTPNSSLPTSARNIDAADAQKNTLRARMKKIASGPQILGEPQSKRTFSSEKQTL